MIELIEIRSVSVQNHELNDTSQYQYSIMNNEVSIKEHVSSINQQQYHKFKTNQIPIRD